MTSVPGVAQRTGATIYYIELFPRSAIPPGGPDPVSRADAGAGRRRRRHLLGTHGSGRAIQRGFVTPDRTILITSTHRVFAMTEKIALGDGRVDPMPLREACARRRETAYRLRHGCGRRADRQRDQRRDVRRARALGDTSLHPRRLRGDDHARRGRGRSEPEGICRRLRVGERAAKRRMRRRKSTKTVGAAALIAQAETWMPAASLCHRADRRRAHARLPGPRLRAHLSRTTGTGRRCRSSLRRRVEPALCRDRAVSSRSAWPTRTRSESQSSRPGGPRFERVREEVQAKDGQIVEIAEYMHPRLQEIAETLPAPLGRLLFRTGPARWLVERLTSKGRVSRRRRSRGFSWRCRSCRLKTDAAALASLRDRAGSSRCLARRSVRNGRHQL